jgi:excisionase family DNA binding protein
VFPRRWITPKECQEYLALKNLGTVYQWYYAGKLPGTRIGRTIRLDLKKLEEQLERNGKP